MFRSSNSETLINPRSLNRRTETLRLAGKCAMDLEGNTPPATALLLLLLGVLFWVECCFPVDMLALSARKPRAASRGSHAKPFPPSPKPAKLHETESLALHSRTFYVASLSQTPTAKLYIQRSSALESTKLNQPRYPPYLLKKL